MALIIQKYGGTSVGSPERIRNVAKRVARYKAMGHHIVVVVSAMSGETNRLIALAKELMPEPDPRELDMIVATGEQVTSALTALALMDLGIKARSYLGSQIKILTDSAHAKARIVSIDGHTLKQDLNEGFVCVVAGFQGVDSYGNITTLGRGGSDTTGVALAAALQADECQIYTDVDGIYTTDPRMVPSARRLPSITFEEMLELASQGSKVLQIRAVEFAGKYKVKLRVLSSFDDDGEGTLITFENNEDELMEKPTISGIAFNQDEAKITVQGVPDKPGIAHKILGPIADANIDVDMIIQNMGADGCTDFTFTVHKNDLKPALSLLRDKVQASIQAQAITSDEHIAKVALVGVGMRSHVGIASKMFRTLAEEGINIQMISTSEIKIAVVIEEKYLELAVRTLHEAFDLASSDSIASR